MLDFKYDFDDIIPLPISSDAEGELCQIMYDDDYKHLMGIARAMLESKELSERALHITNSVVEVVPAFYTIWNYRYNIVRFLYGENAEALDKELDWLDEFTLNNPKNYQIWSYRQAILQLHPKPSFKRELPILHSMIDDDTKNYHVWSYRRWCVLFFKDFTKELAFAGDFIRRDVYNNSAWCHRMFVLKNYHPSAQEIEAEITYAKEMIEKAPQNISPWNYLRGIHEVFLSGNYSPETVEFALSFVGDFFERKFSINHEGILCEEAPVVESSFALELLATVYSKRREHLQKAKEAYHGLIAWYDPIRKNFWEYRLGLLEKDEGK